MNSRAVMLVGCDPDSTEIYTHVLEHMGRPVLHADTADEALSLAKRFRPVALVCGAWSCFGGGVRLRAALRAIPATAGIAVVALCTVPATLIDEEEAVGVDRMLMLPLAPRDLVSAIAELDGGPGGGA